MSPHSFLQGAKALLFTLIFVPPAFADEALNGPGVNRDFAGNGLFDSINPFSGSLKIVTKDLVWPGNGGLDDARCLAGCCH